MRGLRQPLDVAGRAIAILVEATLLEDLPLVDRWRVSVRRQVLQLLAVGVHSRFFVRVQGEKAVLVINDELTVLERVPLLLGQEGQLSLVLVAVNDAGVAALDAPHEEPGQAPKADIH